MNISIIDGLRTRRPGLDVPDEAQATLGEYALPVLPLPVPLFDLDRIVTYTGSVRGAWGDYVIVAEDIDLNTYIICPLRRSELPNVHWLRGVHERSITPQIDDSGYPLDWTLADLGEDDVERIRWWISYYRPAVYVHGECIDCRHQV